jgi:hypothetical protein
LDRRRPHLDVSSVPLYISFVPVLPSLAWVGSVYLSCLAWYGGGRGGSYPFPFLKSRHSTSPMNRLVQLVRSG